MEAVLILLVFGFSATAAPADINVDDVMKYAPEQAEVFAYANFDSMAQPTWDWLTKELAQEKFAQGAEIQSTMDDARAELEQGLREVKQFTGIDPLKDIHYGAIWFSGFDFNSGDMEFLAVVNGDFPDDFAFKMATAMGAPTAEKVGDTTIYVQAGGSGPTVGIAQVNQDILIGTYSELEARAKQGYKRPKASKNSQLERVATKLADGPVFVTSVELTSATRKLIETSGSPRSLIDMVVALEYFDITLLHDGMDIALKADSKEMYGRYEMFMEGFVELLRAAQVSARAITRLSLASLSKDDKNLDPNLRAVLEFREEAVAYVEKYTGDGNFKVTDKSKAKDMTIDLRLRAKHLREVYTPVVGIIIGALSILG